MASNIPDGVMGFRQNPVSYSLVAVSLALYGVSLALPTAVCGDLKSYRGYEVLEIGLFGLLTLDPRWFANIGYGVMVVSALRISSDKAWIATFWAVILATPTLFIPFLGCAAMDHPEWSEALGPGAYFWIAAIWVAALAVLIRPSYLPE
ncbi:hypothetical protein [Niveibacterium sp. SC-1]|uniref:hypothetical protein n=1 Tax=Niveibacterium sp. SC-1 TaxID=3135646 RepID=UPI00311EAD3B